MKKLVKQKLLRYSKETANWFWKDLLLFLILRTWSKLCVFIPWRHCKIILVNDHGNW